MDALKQDFRCIVCDLNTSSLSDLHNHQSSRHTSEELSLSILTLQSFLYHKHYFQTLDAKPLTDVCYFYPFCTQLFSQKGKNIEQNFKIFSPGPEETVVKAECSPVPAIKGITPPPPPPPPEPLRQPLNTATRPTIITSLSLLAKRSSPLPIAPLSTPSDSHAAFLNSAHALCEDLTKLKGHDSQSKVKRKRLNKKKDRPRSLKRDNKQLIQKPPRKPKIDKDVKMDNPQQGMPEDSGTLKIWASKSGENTALGTINTLPPVTLVENLQPIKLQSPTVPIDMINCETALIFNAETGSFQWNPLSFVDKKPEENTGMQGDIPHSALPNQVTHVPNHY